jgi:hypothetical protein
MNFVMNGLGSYVGQSRVFSGLKGVPAIEAKNFGELLDVLRIKHNYKNGHLSVPFRQWKRTTGLDEVLSAYEWACERGAPSCSVESGGKSYAKVEYDDENPYVISVYARVGEFLRLDKNRQPLLGARERINMSRLFADHLQVPAEKLDWHVQRYSLD